MATFETRVGFSAAAALRDLLLEELCSQATCGALEIAEIIKCNRLDLYLRTDGAYAPDLMRGASERQESKYVSTLK